MHEIVHVLAGVCTTKGFLRKPRLLRDTSLTMPDSHRILKQVLAIAFYMAHSL